MARLSCAIPFVATLVACSSSPSGFAGVGNDDDGGEGETTAATDADDDGAADDPTNDGVDDGSTAADDAPGTTGAVDDAGSSDGGSSTTDDGTSSTTTPHEPACGDGWLDDGEDCDDGNLLVGDGCSHHCATESEPPKWVFVTSSTISGAMGGLPGADAICQNLAEAADLPGTYLAWLSDGVASPSSRFVQASTTYALVDGTPIADDWQDLTDGSLAHAIDLTQAGGVPPAGNHTCGADSVWSNVTAAGDVADAASHCEGWTAADGIQSHSGRWDLTTDEWSASCFGGGATCLWFSPIYCFAQ